MLEFLNTLVSANLHIYDLLLLSSAALIIGIGRAGIRGISILAISLFASYFGGRSSASIMLPFLFAGDIIAVLTYRKQIQFSILLKILPAALLGLLTGALLGKIVPDNVFKLIMATLILLFLILMVLKELKIYTLVIGDNRAAHLTAGLAGGIATMMGNTAGPVLSAYLLAMNISKNKFIGTGAFFFFFVNILKFPAHIYIWQSMTRETILFSLCFIPFVLAGFAFGMKIIRKISDKWFRIMVMAATFISTLRIFFSISWTS